MAARVVEREADILADSQRLIDTWHDDSEHAMVRITLAPCSPFSVSPHLMRESAKLARQYGVHLVGEAQDLIEEFYVITVDRRLTHPGVAAIAQAAREGLFAAWNR